MGAKLVAEEGTLKGLELSLKDGEQWVIGRDPDACQLLIEDPLASRKHVMCRTTPQGIILENLSTTNPAQVNNEEVKAPRLLHDGDAVKIGSGTYRFYAGNGATTDINQKNDEETMEDEHRPDTIYEDEPDDKESLAEINFDLVDTGRWLLKVIGGPNNGAEFSMHSSSAYVIGTDPNSCDIVFHDTSVSRQHARISIGADDAMLIEDLKSRNGTLLDGETLKTKRPLPPNTIVSMGTTTFVVYDREGEMHTIISPLLPSIVKVLQKEEPKKAEPPKPAAALASGAAAAPAASKPEGPPKPLAVEKPVEKTTHALGALIVIGIITGLFVVVGLGTVTLFKSEPVIVKEQVNPTRALAEALAPFPSITYHFNKATGHLLLVGHVLTPTDKNQLLYNLQGLNFIKDIDDSGVIIDEYVWQEFNHVLARNPNWKGITIHSPAPGQFVLSGYLQTRKQAEQLSDYISTNFNYLDLLKKNVIVEQDVINSAQNDLQNYGLRDVVVQMSNGDITLTGGIARDKQKDLTSAIDAIKKIPGVRNIRNFVTELAPEQTMVNISDKYEVNGVSKQGNIYHVVINGHILGVGDELDGMTIKQIRSNTIFLEKDGVQYRIDYSR